MKTRNEIFQRARKLREDIELERNTVAHWNEHVRHPDEAVIDFDPDGEMARLAAHLDHLIAQDARVVGGPFEWEDYGRGKYNPQWSGYTAGHYCTGAPQFGWVLYSPGATCWEQRTKSIIAPEPDAQPKRIKGKWFWVVPNNKL